MTSPENKLNPDSQHKPARTLFRVLGPIILLLGFTFMVAGFIDFFRAMGGNGTPDKFWCFFVGLPMLFFGFVFTNIGFMGSIMRYQMRETAPVAKDTFNYMAEGTQEGVKTMASAVGSGLAEGMNAVSGAAGSSNAFSTPEKVIICHKCNDENPAGSKFCNNCGVALAKSKPCARCNELNDPDARFCDNCGSPII